MQPDLKATILKAAISNYSVKGVAATTITDIAKTLKISASQIAYHFGSIDNVYPAVVTFVAESARDYVNSYVDKRSKSQTVFEAYIEGTFRWGSDHLELRNIWSYVIYTASFDENTRRLLSQTFLIAQNRIESSLYEHFAKRKLELKIHDVLVRQIHSLLVGEMVHQAVSKVETSWKKQAAEFVQTVNSLAA